MFSKQKSRDIYSTKYYGQGGEGNGCLEKIKNLDLGGKMKMGKEELRKIT